MQIAGDDYAKITPFDSENGFKLVCNQQISETLGNPQFNFFGRDVKGVTNVDQFWFGGYDNDDDYKDEDDENAKLPSNIETYHLCGNEDKAAFFSYENRATDGYKSTTLPQAGLGRIEQYPPLKLKYIAF